MSEMIPVSGNTYPVKDKLRELGGRWNPDAKAWMVPKEKLQEALALARGVPSKQGVYRSAGPRRKFCEECGEAIKGPHQRCWETGGYCH